jgi:hypothetical protein
MAIQLKHSFKEASGKVTSGSKGKFFSDPLYVGIAIVLCIMLITFWVLMYDYEPRTDLAKKLIKISIYSGAITLALLFIHDSAISKSVVGKGENPDIKDIFSEPKETDKITAARDHPTVDARKQDEYNPYVQPEIGGNTYILPVAVAGTATSLAGAVPAPAPTSYNVPVNGMNVQVPMQMSLPPIANMEGGGTRTGAINYV